MAFKLTTIDLFAAIKSKWTGDAQIMADWPGGIWTDVKEKQPRPYAFLVPMGDAPKTKTNKSQIDEISFELELVVDLLEDLSGRMDRVVESFVKVPMTLSKNNARMILVPDPNIQYIQEANYWKAVVSFVAKVAQSRTDN